MTRHLAQATKKGSELTSVRKIKTIVSRLPAEVTMGPHKPKRTWTMEPQQGHVNVPSG